MAENSANSRAKLSALAINIASKHGLEGGEACG